jgi:hypothetical protein
MYQHRQTKDLIDAETFLSLPDTEKAIYNYVQVKSIAANVSDPIDNGLNMANKFAQDSRDFLPEPFGEIAVGVTALALLIWQLVKRRKVKAIPPP